MHPLVTALLQLDRPLIAAVPGVAFGAGCGLALTADFVLATPATRFCLSFGRVGLMPDFASAYTLPRIVGLQQAKELIFSGREFGAEEARRLGIVYEIHHADRLMDRARALAASFGGASATALSLAKRALECFSPQRSADDADARSRRPAASRSRPTITRKPSGASWTSSRHGFAWPAKVEEPPG